MSEYEQEVLKREKAMLANLTTLLQEGEVKVADRFFYNYFYERVASLGIRFQLERREMRVIKK